jgi:hypothetical protein
MVIKRVFIFIFCFYYSNNIISQNTFLDEINLMSNLRDIQLKNDSNELIDFSFMSRSTSLFQRKEKDRSNSFLKSLVIGYDFQNNTNLPLSSNDGILYPSKGWQERYSYGINLDFGLLDINFQPEKLIAQNLEQEKYLGNPDDGNFIFKYFGMVANNIDHFRQFGYKKIDTTTFGQSRIGLKTKFLKFGFSNENFWWGPGIRNSLVFSNNAGGFKHLYFGTQKPIKFFIGNIEINALSGTIDTTKYLDIDQDLLSACEACKFYKRIDQRKIDAVHINLQPKIFPNLYIGYSFVRQYYKNNKNKFDVPYTFYSKDIDKQILGSLMFRFLLPKNHSEFYGEIGIPEQAPLPWNFFKEKYPRSGFNIVVTHLVLFKKGISFLRLNFEITQLQLMNPKNIFYLGSPFAGGKSNSWYLSNKINQGYSNNGQLIGSFIGPGSNSQNFSIGWHKGLSKLNLFVERISYNNDFYYSVYYNPLSENGYGYYNRYWVDLNLKIEFQLAIKKRILISSSFCKTNSMNYRWIRYEDGSLYDEPSKLTDKFNHQFQLSMKYLLNAIIK